MEVKYINPFLLAFTNIMPQLGFMNVEKKNVGLASSVQSQGIVINVGLVGNIRGNVIYSMPIASGKQIAKVMMMGMDVPEFDEMAQSAISELSNMLTAHAATEFSNNGMEVNISTPTMLFGDNINIHIDMPQSLKVDFEADGIPVSIYVAVRSVAK